jgi:hypothetical protein
MRPVHSGFIQLWDVVARQVGYVLLNDINDVDVSRCKSEVKLPRIAGAH